MNDRTYVPATGNDKAKLMILGEAPSYAEVAQGKPFVGPSGKELDKLLKDSGIRRDEVWLSNVCKYFVPLNAGPKKIPFEVRAKLAGIDLDKEIEDLQNEINNIRPNCILGLGGTALWALTGKKGITDYRGSILYGMGRKVVCTYHPAHLLYSESGEFKGYWNRVIMLLDFKRAYKQSHSSELELPFRNLSICRSSAQLKDFQQRYKDKTRPAVDIEARGSCIPNCIGIAFNDYEGLTVPLWNRGEIEDIVRIPDSDMVQMWIILNEILMNNDIVGQNFKYDQDKINRLGFGIRSLASDTMLKSFVINPELPKGLAFNTSIYTEQPYYKNEGMYDGKLEDLLTGCALDGCVTKEIDLKMDSDVDEMEMRDFYENYVLKLHDMYLDIESEGFYVNQEKKKLLLHKYVQWSESLAYELYQLTGAYINVNSPKQVAILLYQVMSIPQHKGVGEEVLTGILNTQSTKITQTDRRIMEVILEKRRVEKTINTAIMALPDYDGKMKTTFYLCLETGRTSTGQLDPPIRPLVEVTDEHGKKKKKAIGIAGQTMTKHGDIGQDVRSIYEPAPGYVYIQADSAQAEARVVFLLADDEQALKDIDEHDYHALTASWFFGGTEDDYSKRKLGYESPTRFAGKTLRHAGHLGAGKRRAATSVNTDARKYNVKNPDGTQFKIDEGIADRALKIFHLKQPKIRGVFHNGIISCLEKNRRYLIAPPPFGIQSKFGGKRQFFERWGDELFRQAFSYIPQRTITDNTKAAGLRLKNRIPKLRIILESHDSLLFMVKESEVDDYAPLIKEEFERPINFENCSLPRRSLVVPCELEYGYNYMDLKKNLIKPETKSLLENFING